MNQSYTAFEGQKLLANGPLEEVVLTVKKHLKKSSPSSVLFFSDLTGKQMDFDLTGTENEVLQRLQVYIAPETAASSGPGRPKLGVVAREISLLPRHWEWLATQTGGASATLRRLIDESRKTTSGKELVKQAQERTQQFLTSIAGDLPHYEDVLRELYRKDKEKFGMLISSWPADIKKHAKKLSAGVFE